MFYSFMPIEWVEKEAFCNILSHAMNGSDVRKQSCLEGGSVAR